jgi:predicted AAA+ superfamily ATPase
MFERKIEKWLEYWKENEPKKAFILKGAKQTGKTYILNWFCNKNYKYYVYINLVAQEDIKESFKTVKSAKSFLRLVTALFPDQIAIGKTVFFIDEIQELPELIVLIKDLVIDGSYRYILSGSELGLVLKNRQ